MHKWKNLSMQFVLITFDSFWFKNVTEQLIPDVFMYYTCLDNSPNSKQGVKRSF